MLILPQADVITQPYWDRARNHELCLQKCEHCENVWHPPTPVCPRCQSNRYDWTPSSGKGTIYSFTVVQHSTHVAVKDRVPYIVALVTLDEGPRMVANLLDCGPHEVKVGQRVRTIFQQVTPDCVLPQFVLE